MICAAVAGTAASRRSLIPSSRMTWRSPRRTSTSRVRRCRALWPLRGESVSTWFPAMPSSTTDSSAPGAAARRAARRSGQRWLALEGEPEPSVMESPSATIVPGAVDDETLTASKKNQWPVVVVYAPAPASPLWSPAVEMKLVCRAERCQVAGPVAAGR
jgi:hypothetical protein